jgi:hypothetical protein
VSPIVLWCKCYHYLQHYDYYPRSHEFDLGVEAKLKADRRIDKSPEQPNPNAIMPTINAGRVVRARLPNGNKMKIHWRISMSRDVKHLRPRKPESLPNISEGVAGKEERVEGTDRNQAAAQQQAIQGQDHNSRRR